MMVKNKSRKRKISMTITRINLIVLCLFALPNLSFAEEDHAAEHGEAVFHKVRLEVGYGTTEGQATKEWDLDAWVGNDLNRLWIKSLAQRTGQHTEKLDVWALYSRNVSTFWDLQAGLKTDIGPNSLTSLVIGVDGLAPYFFETEAHLFVSEKGDLSARFKQRNDLLITQQLIVQPYLEASLYAQSVKESNIGAGLSKAEFGVQTRYEITRKFAPYFDIRYERKFGETASFAKKANEDVDNFVGLIGLRMFF